MIHLFNILAQATAPSSQPSTQAAAALAAARDAIAAAKDAAEKTTSPWHVDWMRWIEFYNWQIGLTALATLLVFLIAYIALTKIFGKFLDKYQLRRATALGALSSALYAFLWAGHMYRMVDPFDIVAVTVHKLYAAILCLVAIRYIDRLLILPLLTRISGGPPSRFIHQIVITLLSIFVIAGYCSWAFGIELGSLVAGSAVVSIVIGLALQETLGNFFSGMVLQASVPFQPGDWIQIGDVEGRVLEMTWRAVTLLTGANNYVLIPNGTVAKEKIINFHSPTVATAVSVAIGLDYNIPPNDAKHVLIQAAKDTPGVLVTPEPGCALAAFDESAITYKVIFWINEPQKHGGIEQAVRVNIWYRLNQAGMNIPFPMRTVELTDHEKKHAAAREDSTAARLAVLKKSPLFSDIAPELQQKLAAETRDFALAAGQTFFRQGDPGDSLFVLQSGSVAVTYSADDGAVTDVTTLDAPAVFGEISAITGQARGATYRAKTEVRALEIDRDHLQDIFTHDPNLVTHFSQIVAERQKQRDDLLKKAGASQNANQHQHNEPHNVLDRMKRLFSLRMR